MPNRNAHEWVNQEPRKLSHEPKTRTNKKENETKNQDKKMKHTPTNSNYSCITQVGGERES